MHRFITSALVAVALGAIGVANASATPGVRHVCHRFAYVKRSPGFLVIGTLFRHQALDVERYDKTRRHAYGFAHGHVQRRGWVAVSDLC